LNGVAYTEGRLALLNTSLSALEPCLSIDSIDAIVDLANFAEKYHVCYLKNQTSDAIWTALIEGRWKITIGYYYKGIQKCAGWYNPPVAVLFGLYNQL